MAKITKFLWSKFDKILGAALLIFPKCYEFLLKIALFWSFCQDFCQTLSCLPRAAWPPFGAAIMWKMVVQNETTKIWPPSWSTIFDHDHGENFNVDWSWSKPYPLPFTKILCLIAAIIQNKTWTKSCSSYFSLRSMLKKTSMPILSVEGCSTKYDYTDVTDDCMDKMKKNSCNHDDTVWIKCAGKILKVNLLLLIWLFIRFLPECTQI